MVTVLGTLLVTACAPSQRAIDAFKAQSPGGAAGPGIAPVDASGNPLPGGTTGSSTGSALGSSGPTGLGGGLGTSGGLGTTGGSGGTATGTSGFAGTGSTSGGGFGTSGSSSTSSGGGSGSEVGVTPTAIKIGFHGALTINGAVSTDAVLHTKSLAQAYWDQVNRKGGINGRKVEQQFVDDQYDPGIATTQCKTMIKQGMFFIGSTGGADQVVACGQTVPKAGVPYLSVGVSEAGLIGNRHYFPLTLTYDQQAPLIAQLMVHRFKAKASEIALIRANSANFNGPGAAFVTALKGLTGSGPKINDSVDKTGNPQELQGECIKLAQNGIKVVSFLTSPVVTTQFVSVCPNSGLQFVGWANTDPCDTNPNALGSPGMAGCVSVSAQHHATSAPGKASATVKFCHDAWAAEQSNSFPPEQEVICGLFDLMRAGLQATGRDLTRARFEDTLRHLRYDDGLMSPLDFHGGLYATTKAVLWQGLGQDPWHTEIDTVWRGGY